MSKKPLSDDSVRVLKAALRTKLGISVKAKAKKKREKEPEEEIEDEPAPRKQRAERFGFAEAVAPKR